MTSHSIRRVAFAAIVAAAPMACAGSQLMHSDRDEGVPVRRGATWAWGVPDTLGDWDRDPELASEILEQRFRRAFDTAMTDRGLRRVEDPGTADLVLTYHLGVRKDQRPGGRGVAGISVGFGNGGMGWGPGWGVPWPRYGYGYGYDPFLSGWGPSWGWGAARWGYPGWGWGRYGPPVYGGASVATYAAQYGMGTLAVVLRQRSSNEVAWEGAYALDPVAMQRVTQRQVQGMVDRLMSTLR